jgi:alkyl hydroperoxide reductase subunit AhpC
MAKLRQAIVAALCSTEPPRRPNEEQWRASFLTLRHLLWRSAAPFGAGKCTGAIKPPALAATGISIQGAQIGVAAFSAGPSPPKQSLIRRNRCCGGGERLYKQRNQYVECLRRGRAIMALQIGDIAPDFEAETTEGKIHFHDWIGGSWAVLFSHPKDFTPICTTELGYMAKIKPEFDKRGVKIIGLSIDPVDNHAKWANDIKETQGFAPNYPMIGDTDFNVSKLYGMLPVSTSGDPAKRTAADNQTVRNVFVVGPDKKIKLILIYPMTTGRNFDEVLRVIDSLQLTAKHKVATPVNWRQGEDVIIAGSVTDDEAKKTYPNGWKSPKPYIRIVPQPRS